MCQRTKYKISNPRIDKCLSKILPYLWEGGLKTKASCCGHGKYPMTIICEGKTPYPDGTPYHYDLISGVTIPRKRNFYKRDKQGYYYIPEVKRK